MEGAPVPRPSSLSRPPSACSDPGAPSITIQRFSPRSHHSPPSFQVFQGKGQSERTKGVSRVAEPGPEPPPGLTLNLTSEFRAHCVAGTDLSMLEA